MNKVWKQNCLVNPMRFLPIALLIYLSFNIFAGGTGYAQMNIVIKNFPVDIVKNILPNDLILNPPKDTPTDRHPVMFYFSKQNKVTGEFKKIPTAPFIGTFNEFAITIPNVSHKDYPNLLYKYHHIIYLDSRMGILTSKPYKLRKLFMPLESNQAYFKSTKAAQNLILADFYASSVKFDEDHFLEFISQNSIAFSSDLKFHCSSITWKDDNSKKVYFTDPEINLSSKLTPKLKNDIHIRYNQLIEPLEGSFYYENRWYLRKISCFK